MAKVYLYSHCYKTNTLATLNKPMYPNNFSLQRKELETLRNADELSFHGLLDVETLIEPVSFSFKQLLEQARQELKQTAGAVDSVDAILPTGISQPASWSRSCARSTAYPLRRWKACSSVSINTGAGWNRRK
ncbi:hypothetical protein [Billgrantia antri]|uniref:hypothetical protein n=1 Tax=Billgrantia antri TaxID=2846777 RepID=UPI003B220F5D